MTMKLAMLVGMLVLISAPRFIEGGPADLAVEPGTCKNVWGFCQTPHAATFEGGFVVDGAQQSDEGVLAGTSECHKGFFDEGVCPLTSEAVDSCNCLGVPQCGRGDSCGFSCGCNLRKQNLSTPTFLEDQFSSAAGVRFAGNLSFSDGNSYSVDCAVSHNSSMFVHGVRVSILGIGELTRSCPADESGTPPLTMHGEYACTASTVTGSVPLEDGEEFYQEFTFSLGHRNALSAAASALTAMVVMAIGLTQQHE